MNNLVLLTTTVIIPETQLAPLLNEPNQLIDIFTPSSES